MGLTNGVEPAVARAYLVVALAETGQMRQARRVFAALQERKRSFEQLKTDPDLDTRRTLRRLMQLMEPR